ncbi:hypothetical protein V0U79_09000 [Hyphobacterium sp. HN65]|uniref:Uncharacterized protein n=1 Tax=Hyphobacterium lacteum TaxID=3116575 RepID=A0ABU7LRG0_9PROT|nr:hypothetical protein [Hyphobacterium sp. HN65]MEE2526502.1 hypothetical protein [Hyphobacterium sp. HN65]
MILNNLVRSIREQNYYAVFLEFLIVILGVVIGFQISAWNAAQQERRDAVDMMDGLAADVGLAEQLASATLNARLDRVGHLVSAWQQIDDPDIAALGETECLALAASHHFGVTIASLTTLEEIVASGRLGILRDARLRQALSRYEQATDSLREMLQRYPVIASNMTRDFPGLIRITPILYGEEPRVGYAGACDIDGMRDDPAFINALTENMDLYDYFVAAGLRPWTEALSEVRASLEAAQADVGH